MLTAKEATQIANKALSLEHYKIAIETGIRRAAEKGNYYYVCNYSQDLTKIFPCLYNWFVDLGYTQIYLSHEGTRFHISWGEERTELPCFDF